MRGTFKPHRFTEENNTTLRQASFSQCAEGCKGTIRAAAPAWPPNTNHSLKPPLCTLFRTSTRDSKPAVRKWGESDVFQDCSKVTVHSSVSGVVDRFECN